MFFDKEYRRKTRLQKMLSLLTLPETGNLLDMSCGDASLLGEIQKLKPGIGLYGTDISQEAISTAQDKYPNISFQTADASNIAYPNNNFDVIVCSLAMHHYADVNKVLREIQRILKPDGTIYIIDVIPKNKLSQAFYNWMGCREPYHFEKYYTDREALEVFSKQGLRLVRNHHVTTLPRLIGFELRPA